MEPIAVNDVISPILSNLNNEVGTKLGGHCIFINADMLPPLDDFFRRVVEGLNESGNSLKSSKNVWHLCVLLETRGGLLETVERLVSVIRKHYTKVSFVVPSYAYSAGTVLVMSGDEIYMDYYSVLGPIDPQYPDKENGLLLPGAGYLAKFEEMKKKINQQGLANSAAELAYLVNRFEPAKLFFIEQSIKHGESLVSEWLPKYKFKDWTKTETRGKVVTKSDKQKRATEIANKLGDANRWHSHGRGITMHELHSNAIGLKINDFGQDSALSHAIRNYHGMCLDYTQKLGIINFVHTSQDLKVLP